MVAVARQDTVAAESFSSALGQTVPASLFTDFQIASARLRMDQGDERQAMYELLFLVEGQFNSAPLERPLFARTVLDIYEALLISGLPAIEAPVAADTLAAADSLGADSLSVEGDAPESIPAEPRLQADVFLETLGAAIPEEHVGVWTPILTSADSVAVTADMEIKLGPGLQFFRDGMIRDAFSFFEEAGARTDLSDDQRLVAAQLQAWALYSLGRVEDADDAYRAVFRVNPDFVLDDHVEQVREVCGFEIFTPEMLVHFRQVRPIL